MAFGDYTTMTPGSAVADELQNILTRKRLEARQDLLDQLNSKNVQSEIQSRQDQAETNRMYRQAYADQQQSKVDERNRIAADRENRSKIIHDMVANGTIPSDVAPLAESAVGDDQLFSTFLNRYMTPKPSLTPQRTFNTTTGKFVTVLGSDGNPVMVPSGSADAVINYTPRESPSSSIPTVSIIGYDSNGKPIFASNRLDKNGHPILLDATGQPYNGSINKTPSTEYKSPISPEERLKFSSLFGKAGTTGFFGGATSTDRNIAAVTAQALKGKFPANIQQIGEAAIRTQDPSKTSSQEVINGMLSQGIITPEQVPALSDYLSLFYYT